MKIFGTILALLYCSTSEARLRQLQATCDLPATFQVSSTSCNYDAISAAILAQYTGCTDTDVQSFLGGPAETEALCQAAFDASDKLSFEKVLNKGYQFDREFFNGGTSLNSFETATVDHTADMERLQAVKDVVLDNRIIEWPGYLVNFDETSSCASQAAMCCWVTDKYNVGGGTCTGAEGCADADPAPSANTDICYVDMERSKRAAHTHQGKALFPANTEGAANCQGFAWDDHDEMYKGNALFHVAMELGIMGSGYTRSVPGAPMCACVEQMPVVSNAGCTNIATNLTLVLTKEDLDSISIAIGSANISFENCNGQDLADHYASRFDGESLEKHIVGDCNSAAGVEKSVAMMGLVYRG